MKRHDMPPEWALERYRLGELDPERRAEIEAAIEANPEVARRLADLDTQDEAFFAAHPAAPQLAAIRQRAEAEAEPSLMARLRDALTIPPAWTAAPVLGMALVLIWVLRPAPPVTQPPQEKILFKSGGVDAPRFQIHRQRADGEHEILEAGALADEGDILQLSYVAAEDHHGVLFSIDGRGAVTLHFPPHEGDPTALAPSGLGSLDHSYELDDAPDYERFFFITCPEAIDAASILEEARRVAELGDAAGAELPVEEPCQIADLKIRKPEAAR